MKLIFHVDGFLLFIPCSRRHYIAVDKKGNHRARNENNNNISIGNDKIKRKKKRKINKELFGFHSIYHFITILNTIREGLFRYSVLLE